MVRRKRQHVGHVPPKSVLVACAEQRSANTWARRSFFTRLLPLACGVLRRCSLSPGRSPGRLQDHHRGRSTVWVPLGRNAYGSPNPEGKEGQKKPPGSQGAVTKTSPGSQVTMTSSACMSPLPRTTSAGMSPRSDMKSQDFFFSSGLPFCITRTSGTGKREPTEPKDRISLSPGGSPRRLQDHYRGKSSDWISVGRNAYGSEPAEPKNGAKMLKFPANKPPVYRAGGSAAVPEGANASGIR